MELKNQEQLKKELSAPLPAEAIKPHPTKTYLSSIKAIYVTERLNDVFGIGKWKIYTQEVERGDKGMVVVKVTFTVPDYDMYYECYGGNDNGGDGSKNFDLGDAYKGATTDAITKIGSYLGIAIDVFKGKVQPPKSPPNNTTPKVIHPQLVPGTSKWAICVEGIANDNATIELIRQKNTLSDEHAAQMLREAKILKQEQAAKI